MNGEHKKPRVFIADQDEEFRIMLRKILEESGAEVEAVANGKQVVALCAGIEPDIVFLQAALPELDGFSACQEIRKLPGGKTVPIILLAEMDDGVTDPVSQAVGATECIVKPLDWLLLSCRIIVALRTYCGLERYESYPMTRGEVFSYNNGPEDSELLHLVKRLQQEMGKDVLHEMLKTMLESVEKTQIHE